MSVGAALLAAILLGSQYEPAPFSAAGDPPVPVPAGGVDADKLDPSHGEAFTVNGVRVDRQTAFESLRPSAGVDFPDDSNFLRITVIGGEADRKKVLSDLKTQPKFAELLKNTIVRDYAPDNWAVRECGFVTSGTPTIYIQASSGKVLHRQDDYGGGSDRLAGAIRRARPDYDPKKDPDLMKPAPPPPLPASPAPPPPPEPVPAPAPVNPAPPGSAPPWGLLTAIAAIAAYFFATRRPATAQAV